MAQHYQTYEELQERGITRKNNKGTNNICLDESTVRCKDGTAWDFIESDGIYELRLEDY